MSKIQEAFALQIEQGLAGSGLNTDGKYPIPFNLFIEQFNCLETNSTEPQVVEQRLQKLKDLFDSKVKDYADHVGQFRLYFYLEVGSALSVRSCWSGDLDTLDKYQLVQVPVAPNTIPKFKV